MNGEPKVGRWIYCKYCYKNVIPQINYFEDLIQCSECNYGLAPLDEVIKAGSYKKWYEKIELDFVRSNRYLDEIGKGLREPDGKDEYGIVPDICTECKKELATVFVIGKLSEGKGIFCDKCHRKDLNKQKIKRKN